MKERKIGETFEYEGKRLIVKESKSGCDDCFFNGQRNCKCRKEISGYCGMYNRSDRIGVIFVEVKYEQPQELNICEALKFCPEGMDLWSPLLGKVKLLSKNECFITVTTEDECTWDINADGTMAYGDRISIEPMLYPSREQRDWTKVKYEPKKKLPKTWREFCKNYLIGKAEYFLNSSCRLRETRSGAERQEALDRNILPSKQAAEAHLALMQLHQLRDAWREGWVPDWNNDNQGKYVILKIRNEYEVREYKVYNFFLSFQDEKRADEFKDCFIDLIMKAGDLI